STVAQRLPTAGATAPSTHVTPQRLNACRLHNPCIIITFTPVLIRVKGKARLATRPRWVHVDLTVAHCWTAYCLTDALGETTLHWIRVLLSCLAACPCFSACWLLYNLTAALTWPAFGEAKTNWCCTYPFCAHSSTSRTTLSYRKALCAALLVSWHSTLLICYVARVDRSFVIDLSVNVFSVYLPVYVRLFRLHQLTVVKLFLLQPSPATVSHFLFIVAHFGARHSLASRSSSTNTVVAWLAGCLLARLPADTTTVSLLPNTLRVLKRTVIQREFYVAIMPTLPTIM
ncbi:unnamed protein product, partial [Ceratitis capitata]